MNGRPNRIFITLVAICLLLGFGCKRPTHDAVIPHAPPTQERWGRTKILVGNMPLWAEIADTPEKQEQGLMYRTSLPEDEGMLFVFDYPQPLTFWMKNTSLPLDIAFIALDHTILNIQAMKPLDENSRYMSDGPAQYALEVNQGWFARHGIQSGTEVNLR